MRVDPSTGKIISYEDYFCPNCHIELDESDIYCKECDIYLGEIVQTGGSYSEQPSNKRYNRKDFEQYRAEADRDFNRLCCGVFLILLLFSMYCAWF